MLLLLHGALGAKSHFDLLQAHRAQATPPTALNFPGHGGKPVTAPFSLKNFADEVIQFLDAHHTAQADLLGYSLGGYVALCVARWHPERIGRIWTLNTKWEWSPESTARMQGMMNPEKIEAKAPEMARRFAALHAPEDWKTVARQTVALLGTLGTGAGLRETDFGYIQHPVVLMRGADDAVVSDAETQHVARLLPHGSRCTVPDSGHLPEQVNWEAVARVLASSS